MSRGSRVLCVSGGGITVSGSLDLMRRTSALRPGSPLTITGCPLVRGAKANSGRSRRSSASRLPGSDPWQRKQLATKIGRMCWLKEMVSGRAGTGVAAGAGVGAALRQDTNGAAAAATRATGRTDASSRTREPFMECCEG